MTYALSLPQQKHVENSPKMAKTTNANVPYRMPRAGLAIYVSDVVWIRWKDAGC